MSRSIAHYEILERIAEGGMGIVYKARDTGLDRLVALKFLPNETEDAKGAFEAFLHEARAISRLNHPNIATIYGVEEVNGERFLALEYLPGGTLRDRLRAHPQGFPLERILGWAIPIARALAHSHRHGIIHRDVKSDNVLLTEEGRAKLTDFGVAQVLGGAQPRAGETAGTTAYMSPEQAQGLELDHRTDVFSFGAMLYEMAAGRPPFYDQQEAVVLYDIVNSATPALERDDLPSEFGEVLDRLLAKSPKDRYQSMEAVVEALSALRREPDVDQTGKRKMTQPAEPAIAVLPFVDMSPDGDQEYFCDGITEEITLALSKVRGLRVVSRTSTFQYKGQAYDIRKIGQQLKVAGVLEGSVRKAADTLRISVQLVKISDGYHVWSERYDRKLEDVFAIQEEIAESIVEAMKLRLATRGPDRKRPTEDLDAYNDYLSGRYLLNQRSQPSIEKALKKFDRSLELDPNFGLAWGAKAETMVLLVARGAVKDTRAAFDEARRAAERGIELEPERAEPYVALALVKVRADWDWAGAEQAFKWALEKNDGYATAHHQYAMFLAMVMRLDEARREIERAHELDPLSLLISSAVGRILHFSRRYEEAVAQCLRTSEADPTFAPALFDRLVSLSMLDRIKEAYEVIQQLDGLHVDPIRRGILMGRYYGLTGDRERALEERSKLMSMSSEKTISPVFIALIDMTIGELDRAMELLEQAADDRDDLLVYLQCEPSYDPIRDHPRYAALIERVGFPPAPGNPIS